MKKIICHKYWESLINWFSYNVRLCFGLWSSAVTCEWNDRAVNQMVLYSLLTNRMQSPELHTVHKIIIIIYHFCNNGLHALNNFSYFCANIYYYDYNVMWYELSRVILTLSTRTDAMFSAAWVVICCMSCPLFSSRPLLLGTSWGREGGREGWVFGNDDHNGFFSTY